MSGHDRNDEIRAEAFRRYPPSKLVEDYDGDRYVDDDHGYDEMARNAFIAGAEWRSPKPAITLHILDTPRCAACGQVGHNCPTGGRLLR